MPLPTSVFYVLYYLLDELGTHLVLFFVICVYLPLLFQNSDEHVLPNSEEMPDNVSDGQSKDKIIDENKNTSKKERM